VELRLAVGVALTLVTSALLAYVGALVSRRRAAGDARTAIVAFAAWWYAAALVILLAGAHTLLGLLGVTDIAVYTANAYLTQLPLAVGLCALLYYLLYLYTGRTAAIRPLTIAYALFLAFGFYNTAAAGPRHLETTAWDIRATGAPLPGWLTAFYGLALLAPALFVVGAYGLLLRRVRDPEPRARLRATSLAFVLWFAPVLAGFLLGWSTQPWFALVYQVPGVLAAALIALAHRPPTAARRRLDPEETQKS
jgi:hypothetical protein